MRPAIFTTLIILSAFVGGCHKKRTLTNFGLKAGMTEEEIEDQMGSPAKKSPSWVAYNMSDGSELRLFFLEKTGDTRTLSQADLYVGEGQFLQVTHVFNVHSGTSHRLRQGAEPATEPSAKSG